MENFHLDPNTPVESLLQRAEALIGEEHWELAEAYCNVAIDLDSENYKAWLFRLMAEVNVSRIEEIATSGYSIKDCESYVKATELCDEATKKLLEEYAEATEKLHNESSEDSEQGEVDESPDEHTQEEKRPEKGKIAKIIVGITLGIALVAGGIFICINATPYLHTLSEYNNAVDILNSGDYDVARTAFVKLDGFKDSEEYVEKFSCLPTYTEEIIKITGKDEVYNRVDYQYEKNGNILKSTVTDREGNVLSESINTYDNNGLLISSEVTEENNNSSSSFGYNDKGQITKETITYESGIKVVYDYTYDEFGNNTEKKKTTLSDGSEVVTSEHFAYNELGQAVKCTYMKGGMTVSTTTYEYDEYGNRTVATGDNGTSSKYEYLYDMDGNLLKIIEKSYKRGDVLQSEIERNYCDYHYYYKA